MHYSDINCIHGPHYHPVVQNLYNVLNHRVLDLEPNYVQEIKGVVFGNMLDRSADSIDKWLRSMISNVPPEDEVLKEALIKLLDVIQWKPCEGTLPVGFNFEGYAEHEEEKKMGLEPGTYDRYIVIAARKKLYGVTSGHTCNVKHGFDPHGGIAFGD